MSTTSLNGSETEGKEDIYVNCKLSYNKNYTSVFEDSHQDDKLSQRNNGVHDILSIRHKLDERDQPF